jgi:hypothetical protein
MSTTPTSGDVVVVMLQDGTPASYALAISPEPPQLRFEQLQDAIAAAQAWSARGHVRAWFTRDGQTFEPLDAIERLA